MSAPSAEHPVSLSTSGYHDGLGLRTLIFDREHGVMLERLLLRPELGAFELALRARAARIGALDDERFARVRSVERDPDTGWLSVLSEFVTGNRLCDLIEASATAVRDENAAPSVDVALGYLIAVLPVLASLHAGGIAHGAVGPGRVLLTPAADIVLLDTIYAEALERLQFSTSRFWTELGLGMPPVAGPVRFDAAADLAQASLGAVALVLGRPLGAHEYPDGIAALLVEVVEIAQIRGSGSFASALQHFLQRTLPLPGQRPYASSAEAQADLKRLVHAEMGAESCRAALAAFVTETSAASEPPVAAVPAPAKIVERAAAAPATPRAAQEPKPAIPPTVTTVAAAPKPSPSPAPAAPVRSPASVKSVPTQAAPPPAPAKKREEPLPAAKPTPAAPTAAAPTPLPPPVAATTPPPAPPPPAAVAPPIAAAAPPAPPVAVQPEAPFAWPKPEAVPIGIPLASAPARPPIAIPLAPEPEQPKPADPPPVVEAKVSPKTKGEKKRHRGPRLRDKLRSIAAPQPQPPAPVEPPAPPPPPARPPLIASPPAVFTPPPEPAWRPAALAPPQVAAPVPIIARPIVAPPVVPTPPPMGMGPIAPPMQTAPMASTMGAPLSLAPPVSAPAIRLKSEPAAPVRIKSDAPIGFAPPRRPGRPEPSIYEARLPPPAGQAQHEPSSFPWKLAAAVVIVMAIGVTAGRAYLPSTRSSSIDDATPPVKIPAVSAPVAAPPARGSIVVETQPAGAHILLDGKPAGDSPLRLDDVPPGRHVVTVSTASASVKKVVKVDPGKTVSVDLAVYSGWVSIYSPIVLEVAEAGQPLGTTEQSRLMLPPGHHSLTLTNRELAYSIERGVDIEPGEERTLNLQPLGVLSVNAQPWAEIWIDGKRAGETPLANVKVALGTREVIFKHPEYGERRMTITVRASAPSALSVDMTKPPDR